ncbi:hypothetical protein PIIN_10249 [Serendipita indica DSM 11827]|uniref:Transmembrane protein n=1 Tax=Serendipita indica (strain DSM 11827) TaxID=1109443 RepID=G4TY61_SERID|nr:hypothetical protein PIIN_10249 [Serendipita indica DSM 11827]
MYLISRLDKRQSQMPPPDSQDGSQTANDSRMPNYVWAVVVFFVLVGVVACFYAQRNHRRRYLLHQAALGQGHGPGLHSQRPDRTWILDTAAVAAGIRRPVRAARPNLGRRGSQASITSLPVYMENAGAHEVVLMQRTAPKEIEAADERDRAVDSRPSSMAHSSPTTTLPVVSIVPAPAPSSIVPQYQPPSSPPPSSVSTPPPDTSSHPSPPTESSSSPLPAREEATVTSQSVPVAGSSAPSAHPPFINPTP